MMSQEYREHSEIENWVNLRKKQFSVLESQGYGGLYLARTLDGEIIGMASVLSTLIEDIVDYSLDMKNKCNDNLEEDEIEYEITDFLESIKISTF